MTGALGIILRDGKVLLIKRGIEPYKEYWCPPGGVQEEEETLDEAARREVKEETGLEVEAVEELGRVVGPMTGNYHHIFLCRPLSGGLKPSPPEAIDARWVPYEETTHLRIPPFIKEFMEILDMHDLERILTRDT